MDLFELFGKIVISGTDEANRNIDSVADNAEKNAQRICSAFEKIGSTVMSHGAEIRYSDADNLKNRSDNEAAFVSGSMDTDVNSKRLYSDDSDLFAGKLFDTITRISDSFVKSQSADISLDNSHKLPSEDFLFNKSAEPKIIRDLILSEGQYNPESAFNSVASAISQIINKATAKSVSSEIISASGRKDFNYSGIKGDADKINTILDKVINDIDSIRNIPDAAANECVSELSESLNLMEKTIKRKMPRITQLQLSELDRLCRDTGSRWNKMADAAYTGTSKMADGIKNAAPAVMSVCSAVADSVSACLELDATDSGMYIMDTFKNGLSQKAWEIYNTISGIAQNISSIMSGVTFSGISVEGMVESTSLPHYATGGIVTREHIARVGEDGAEAIIPLEHNTEWIDKVAARMSGSTSNSAVAAKLDEVISLLKNQKIYLDGRTLVGGIANEMDRKLGSMARLKGRV
ncbi:MAG: hypothetical protein IJX24_06640 [Oscillospiraceae bacterium]|nr:hypothetical protein [Oscillospiraceae bacterium]